MTNTENKNILLGKLSDQYPALKDEITKRGFLILTMVQQLALIEDTLHRPADDQAQEEARLVMLTGEISDLFVTSYSAIYGTKSTESFSVIMKEINEIEQEIFNKRYQSAIVLSLRFIENHQADLKLANMTLSNGEVKWLTFGASLANVKSADDLAPVLINMSNRLLSYRSKRTNDGLFYGSVNGYLGVAAGRELLQDSGHATGKSRYSGIWAPIGLEVGMKTHVDCLPNFGVLLIGADFGNLASQRTQINQSSTDNTSSKRLSMQQVFSPGAALVLGVSKNYPLSLAAGYEYVPALREDAGKTLAAHHFFISFSVDVTFFPF